MVIDLLKDGWKPTGNVQRNWWVGCGGGGGGSGGGRGRGDHGVTVEQI